MKKISALLILALSFLLSLPAAGQAKQATIQTRKVRLSDFPTKTTKVVLAGSEMFNNALQEEMARRWLASPLFPHPGQQQDPERSRTRHRHPEPDQGRQGKG